MAQENNGSYSHSRSDTPTLIINEDQDETMKQLEQVTILDVPEMSQEVICEYVHESLLTKDGTIFNFINSSCPGASSSIGGLRCNLKDATKIPAYIDRNRNKIKLHAIKALDRHIRESRCAIGAMEDLTVDDYGLTFALASVTHEGANLNPYKRHEGPLWYCMYPNLCESTVLKVECWDEGSSADRAFIINTYIHLLPAIQRRNKIIEKAQYVISLGLQPKKDEVERKKPKLSPSTSYDRPSTSYDKTSTMTYGQRKDAEHKALQEKYASLQETVSKLERERLPNPPLPPTKGVVWPPKNVNEPDMPDDLWTLVTRKQKIVKKKKWEWLIILHL